MASSNLEKYTKDHEVLRAMLEYSPTTLRFFVNRMQDHLDDYDITLPSTRLIADETESQKEERVATLNDYMELLENEKLPPLVDAFFTGRYFQNLILCAVWHQDFYNPALRVTMLAAEEHLKGKKKSKRKYIGGSLESRKRPRSENPLIGFSPEVVIEFLLDTLNKYHCTHYGSLLADPDLNVKDFVLSNLPPLLSQMFFNGIPTEHEILQKLGQDMSTSQPAIYMHVINDYRYVGQARELSVRVFKQHGSKVYRSKNPCLHYYVWEQLEAPVDFWVLLANVPIFHLKPVYRGLVLNIFEMLCALLFQTLPDDALDVYLDPKIARQSRTRGLNVALPIHQGHSVGDSDVGTPIHYLRDTSDSLMRRYYQDARERQTKTCIKTRLHKTLQKFIEGVEITVNPGHHKDGRARQWLYIRSVRISITRRYLEALGIDWGDTVVARCEVSSITAHEWLYAVDALTGDAANRLAIICASKAGKEIYIQNEGDNVAQRANALVDELEGVSREESLARGRRIF
ncbi:MAG: hypothetical protein LQ343_002342 [Gyalolechia ehrenbergii]|nr:MAG: hypothetical protein LQ343_002342 [Gyalolechia ehrenbergii]